jgi:hypothetical protein
MCGYFPRRSDGMSLNGRMATKGAVSAKNMGPFAFFVLSVAKKNVKEILFTSP